MQEKITVFCSGCGARGLSAANLPDAMEKARRRGWTRFDVAGWRGPSCTLVVPLCPGTRRTPCPR
jgi:hypothetical protein